MLFILLIFVVLAALLAWFLISHDKGEKEPIAVLWLAAAAGLIGALMAGTLEHWLIPAKNLDTGAPLGAAFGAAMMVGLIEEVVKFAPLAVFLYKKRYFNEHTDGVIYFALAGLGFGLPENLLYTMEFGHETGVARLLLTPLLHAAITGLIGYFLARRKLAGKPWWGIIGPLAVAIVLHGLYDFGLISGVLLLVMLSILITLGLSTALFFLFLRATQLDQDRGLSVVGHNSFCRSCGKPNPKHNLYCAHCGKNA